MKLKLTDLKPNPVRDFKVDPVDKDHVAMLAQSIRDYGFWSGVTARRHKGDYQVAGGWHRVNAAIEAGETHADIFVGDFDDAKMLDIYAAENATQRGNPTSGVAGSIAGALKEILRGQILAPQAGSQNGGDKGRHGIGQPAIKKRLEGVPGITARAIDDQLASLKSSGEYDRIVSDVIAEAEAEQAAQLRAIAEAQAEAERREKARVAAVRAAEKAAEERRLAEEERARHAAKVKIAREAEREAKKAEDRRRAEEARAKAEHKARKAEAARKEAAARAEAAAKANAAAQKAAAEAKRKAQEETARKAEIKAEQERIAAQKAKAEEDAKKRPIEFDIKVTQVFKVPAHVETFREMVTKEEIKKILPVSSQVALAKAILAERRENELSSSFITKHLYRLANDMLVLQGFVDKAAKKAADEAFRKAAWQTRWNTYEEYFETRTRSLISIMAELIALGREDPDRLSFSPKVMVSINRLETQIANLKKLNIHIRPMEGKAVEAASAGTKVLHGEILRP